MNGTANMQWTMDAIVGAIVGFVTVTILIGAVFFAWRQVRAARLGIHAQIMIGLVENLRNSETIDGLRLIYGKKPEEIQKSSRDDMEKIGRILDRLDMIGHLAYQGVLNEYLVAEAFAGPTALRCWHQLRQYIEKNRETRGGRYCVGVQYLAEFTIKYQIKNMPKDQWVIYYRELPDSKDSINLIEKELAKPELLSRWELHKVKAKRSMKSIYKRELKIP